jgi:hypothetical protein
MWAIEAVKFWETQAPKNTAELAKDFAFQAIIRRFSPGASSICGVGEFIKSAAVHISARLDSANASEFICGLHLVNHGSE